MTKGKNCLVCIRPEAVSLKPEGTPAQHCAIKSAIYMRNHWEVIANWHGEELLINLSPESFEDSTGDAYLHFSKTGLCLLPNSL
ncbi:MAG: hypothetical protein CSA47_00225 [Gammaproteobacteria bacterium]|nr:MAG: hypothetical protein CSA47_00225 [Gammaproteobacteria bacterium]